MKCLFGGRPLLLAAALGSVFSLPIKSENTDSLLGTNAVTMAVLVGDALGKNPELEFYAAEIEIAKASRKNAGLLSNPEFNGSVGHKSLRNGGMNSDGVAWSVAIVQPFEWPGRIGLRKAIANRDVELAELGLERFRAALAGRVRALAFGLFAAQELSAATGEVAERFQSLRDVLLQRDPAGLTPLLETRIIEATELSMQRKATDAILATQTALLELNQLRGMPAGTSLKISPAQLSFRPADNNEILLALARTNNFELRLRAAELAQQGFRVDLARNERFPAISVGPSITEERAGDHERIVGLSVSLPLPLWNRNQANIDLARNRQSQAQVSLQVADREIQRQVLESALKYDTKRREIRKWRPDSIQHFKEAAELTDRHYRLGAVPISTYVELQKQYLEAVETLLETKKEALKAAQELELLTGLTPPLVSTEPEEAK